MTNQTVSELLNHIEELTTVEQIDSLQTFLNSVVRFQGEFERLAKVKKALSKRKKYLSRMVYSDTEMP